MYIPRWTTYIVFLATTATISTNGALGRPVHYPMTYSHLQNSVDLPRTLLRVVFNHPSSDRPVSIEMEALAEVATMVAVKAHISGTLGDVGMMNFPNLPPGTRKSTFEVNGGRVCEKGCDGMLNLDGDSTLANPEGDIIVTLTHDEAATVLAQFYRYKAGSAASHSNHNA